MKHHLIIRFDEHEDKKKLYNELKEFFKTMENVPEIRKVSTFRASSSLSGRFDMMVRFDIRKEDLDKLEELEAYRSWQDGYKDRISDVTVFDCL